MVVGPGCYSLTTKHGGMAFVESESGWKDVPLRRLNLRALLNLVSNV